MLMLDDCTPENGPLQIVRGGHGVGPEVHFYDEETTSFPLHTLTDERMEALLETHEAVDCLGPAGSVVMFSGLTVHGSAENRSARPRCVAFFVYNRADNRPTIAKSRRRHVSPHQFNTDPVELGEALDDGALLRLAEVQETAA